MALALFDLDNTLLGGDSDHAWGEFVCTLGVVDAAAFGRANEAFYSDYQAGCLDIQAYLRHALAPLVKQPPSVIAAWREQFMASYIEPLILPGACALLQQHREQGDELLIITATNSFISAPIAARLGVANLLACEAEIVDGYYTGEPLGTPSYGAGKLTRLREWLVVHSRDLRGSWFYSDSHNDLPLLQAVDHAVAVDPDERLRNEADRRGWPIISLR